MSPGAEYSLVRMPPLPGYPGLFGPRSKCCGLAMMMKADGAPLTRGAFAGARRRPPGDHGRVRRWAVRRAYPPMSAEARCRFAAFARVPPRLSPAGAKKPTAPGLLEA